MRSQKTKINDSENNSFSFFHALEVEEGTSGRLQEDVRKQGKDQVTSCAL